MTEENKNSPGSPSGTTQFPDSAQIHGQAEQKAKTTLQTEQSPGEFDRANDILNEISDGVWSLTWPDLEIAYLSPSIEEIYGRPLQDFYQNPALWQEVIHPEDRCAARKAFEQLGKTGSARREYRILRPDGSSAWIADRSKLVFDKNNNPQRVDGVCRDISERKKAEYALQESEEKFRFMTEQMNDVVWTSDMDMRVTYISPSDERILGFTPEERKKHGLVDMLTASSQELAIDVISKEYALEESGKGDLHRSLSIDLEYLHKDGSTRWLETLATGIRDDKGRLIGLHGVSRDITDRKKAEQQLQISEKRVRAKLDAVLRPHGDIGHLDLADIIDMAKIRNLMDDFYKLTNIGSAIVDLSGNILAGTEFREICARFHRMHPVTSENCMESDTKLSEGIKPGHFREYRCKNNMRDIATPIFIGDKHFGNIFIGQFFYDDEDIDYAAFRAQARKFGFDEQTYMEALDRVPRFNRKAIERAVNFYSRFAEMISTLSYSNLKLARTLEEHKRNEREREKLQAQLSQAQKMESVGRLAGGVAHDFNNKLSIINGYAEIAMDTIDPSEPLYDSIREIHTAGKQSAEIVRQLLAFARKQTISPVLLSLNDIISSMLKMLQRLIGENIDLAWYPGSNLSPVMIDPSQVDQIMANLAVNSRDAISDVGKLIIETSNIVVDEDYCRTNPEAVSGQYVMLAVSDDGCGMEKEVKDFLFEPFFTTKEVGKGTGLGLPTIYGIVKQNNGFINVYSEPGQGTTVKIYLPARVAEKSSLRPANDSTRPMPAGTETILVVEDEKAILRMSKQMLERLGYTVETAGNPFEALQISDEYDGTIHLLITDVVMPEMNGRDLSSRLVKSHPGLKTLYMSGYTANVIAHHGVIDEGVKFIQKPFSLKDLAVKVRKVIDRQ